jgi:cation transport ATPase
MKASVIGPWLPRRTVSWLLTVPFAVLVLFGSFQLPFISAADPENYYSHAVAWVFVTVMCALSFARSELWKPGEQRTSTVMVRGSIAICAAAVVLDVVGDVLIPEWKAG